MLIHACTKKTGFRFRVTLVRVRSPVVVRGLRGDTWYPANAHAGYCRWRPGVAVYDGCGRVWLRAFVFYL